MEHKKTRKDSWQEKRDQEEVRAGEIAATLPESKDELLEVARLAMQALDFAVLVHDEEGLLGAAERYAAVIWKLNGGKFFGCQAGEDSPGHVVEKYCQAEPGCFPLWGQRGEFLVEANGIRAMVEVEGGYSYHTMHLQFRAVDLDTEFISETGYRSHYDGVRYGMRVEEVAQSILAQMCAEGTTTIEQKYRDARAEALPEWLDQIDPPPRRESTLVPPGFVYVDAVLPKHQAFLARKWAEQAQEKVKAARAAMFNAREEVVEEPVEFKKGLRCEVVQVRHKVFEDNIGKKVIITEVRPDTR